MAYLNLRFPVISVFRTKAWLLYATLFIPEHPERLAGEMQQQRSSAQRRCRHLRSQSSSTVTCSEGKIWWYIEKVVIIGATREIGRTAIVAVSKARGMELAGAIDSQCVGLDAGEINGMEEALEIPVLNDLTMVLGSIAQSRATGVVVDFSEPSTVYDNVKQAAAFGLNSVVYVPNIELDTVTELSAFCEKASMPGRICHHKMQYRLQIIYQILVRYTTGKISDNPARGQILGEDGVRVHSMVLPGLASSTSINFSGPGEIYTLRHDVTNVQCLMPGLILAIRKVVRLKNLIYGLEKFL
uniref:Dihydrodipicolinate reductase, N-terminus family protein n=1 Tax=Oryza sativa subsp. japonica TaxID=39947 RepID=Q10SM9_ORYSJ|nr:Dihydrodipicolinate reductase, N-terminus family protein [Oryza sativa Japonica Group]